MVHKATVLVIDGGGRAEAARARAQQLMAEAKSRDDVDYSGLVSKLERELTRLKVARKRKYRDVGRPDQA